MRVMLGPLAVAFLASCASHPQLPATEKPTLIVNQNYARTKVRHYEVYLLPRSSDHHTEGYRVAFVHMTDGREYPVPCMPTSDGIRPTLEQTVKRNRKNNAWTVTTYLPRKKDHTQEFVEADFVRFEGGLYLNGRKLRPASYVTLID